MNRTVLLLPLLVSSSALAWDGGCEHSAERTVDIAAAQRLAIEAAAGDLEVRGEPGLARASAVGRACASSEELLAQIELVAVVEGGVPTIRARMPQSRWTSDDEYAYLDLRVRVPTGAALRIADSSGDANVRDVAALDVVDSSGDLEIEGVNGEVSIDDNSGDVDVRGAGSVAVRNDSSGDIDIANVERDVRIASDSSGDIDIDDVRGDASIGNDSSGDIEFRNVRGSASVDRDSSGGVRASHIGGDFIVRADGSGGIEHSDVAGRVDVPDDD